MTNFVTVSMNLHAFKPYKLKNSYFENSMRKIIFQQSLLPPMLQETGGDPFNILFDQRIIFMSGEINDFKSDSVVSHLIFLDAQDDDKDIRLYINSPGGSVTSGMGIYDAMVMCQANIQTVCLGLAASMGAFLLGAGTKGKRSSLPNSRIMIHQPLGGASGAAVEIEIQAREIMYHKANINRIMASYTCQAVEKIELDTDRDRYMSPLEAIDYGLIDNIIGGEDAMFKIGDSTLDFTRTKKEYIAWGNDKDDGSRSTRFKGIPIEPFTKPLA